MEEELGFCCPLCGGGLSLSGSRALCPEGHSFDRARQGYLHLLPVHKMHAKLPGDSREMVEARRRFLDAGYYAPFQRELCRLARQYTPARGIVGDAGCGEGTYTNAVQQALPGAGVYGFDISKLAVKAAAGRYKQPRFAVASCFAIPLPTGFCDCLVDVFSPLAAEEFARVVKPGGVFLYAVPGPRHLFGLKEILYEKPYENPCKDTAYPGFRFLGRTQVRGEIQISGEAAARDLFAMTPYYWKTGADGAARLRETPKLSTEIAFDFLAYRRE